MAESFKVPGYTLVRLLSDRERSKLFLARDETGALCAIKLHKPRDPDQLEGLVERNQRLAPLTRQPGFFQILAHGATESGWTWKALPLADNLLSLPPVTTNDGVQQYTPLNFLAWRAENAEAPPPAKVVAQWGVRLAEALSVLHRGGLVHRDVKPANVLFLGGEPALGDYGLVGVPGEEFDYRGTEGFQPLEGTNDVGTDLFALGKTLYEVWTAGNRLEFPSLPRAVLEAPDWKGAGSHLNDVLLRACHSEPRKRFRSAAEMSVALADVVSGRRPVSRRRWLGKTVAVAVVGAGLFYYLKKRRVPAKVVWRRLRDKGFNVEMWQGHAGTADWARGRLYSAGVDHRGCLFQAVDLSRFTLESQWLPNGPKDSASTILHPQTRELWLIEGGNGPVYALDLQTMKLRPLGGGPHDKRHFTACTYWNPITGRIGIFGGYGHHAMHNDRMEFDPEAKQWVKVEPDRDGPGPWRRGLGSPLLPDDTGQKVYLVGGSGSQSGKQGDRMAGVRGFAGHFHLLDDIWELDLATSTWRCLLPLGHFDPARLRAAAFFPQLQGLVVFEGAQPGDENPGSPKAWLVRPGVDDEPVPLPTKGDPSRLFQAWCFTVDPNNGELLMFAEDGIFRIELQKP